MIKCWLCVTSIKPHLLCYLLFDNILSIRMLSSLIILDPLLWVQFGFSVFFKLNVQNMQYNLTGAEYSETIISFDVGIMLLLIQLKFTLFFQHLSHNWLTWSLLYMKKVFPNLMLPVVLDQFSGIPFLTTFPKYLVHFSNILLPISISSILCLTNLPSLC